MIFVFTFMSILKYVLTQPPPAFNFQHPLPDQPKKLADMDLVKNDLIKLMNKLSSDEHFHRLAYQCASTFRATDYSGGCNGARIRFPPGSEWPINAGLNETIEQLTPIKLKYGDGLSYADLFVLAGNVATERMTGSMKLKFCPGRTDDSTGSAWDRISYGNTDPPSSVDQMIELLHRRGQTYKDFVALTFVRFKTIKSLRAVLNASNGGSKNAIENNDITIQALQYHPEIRYWAEKFASLTTNDDYATAFAESWTRLMNADRFNGPIRNLCA
jgi:catalase (peroxidase I)